MSEILEQFSYDLSECKFYFELLKVHQLLKFILYSLKQKVILNQKQLKKDMEHHIPELATVKQCSQYIPALSEKAIRWKLFHDEEFRKRCARKFGKRVYIIPREVIKYIMEQPSS